MLAYNSGPVIEAAIKSTYPFVDEIIVVDGSAYGPSTDGTAERALSVGPKVKVVSGTYVQKNGSWDEQAQRQAYLDRMERGQDQWGLLQDSDEVYGREQILTLLGYILSASEETLLFSHGFVHFWRNLHQVMTGGAWSLHRDVCAFRLTPLLQTTGVVTIGEGIRDDLCHSEAPRRIILRGVFSYHYGHALPYERLEFKVKEYFLAGYYSDRPHQTLERFLREYKERFYRPDPNILSYTGPQPEEIKPLIGTYFKE